MLIRSHSSHRPQNGLVLVLALIVLAALSLAAVGLMRGVLSSNRVAGNLAYQEAAVHAADVGVETAIAWLEQKSRETVPGAAGSPPSNGNKLWGNITKASGETYNYLATRSDPAASQTWDSFWQTLATNGVLNDLPTDALGNKVSFVIHRLCANAGSPISSRCEIAPAQAVIGDGGKRRDPPISGIGAVYYRITVKVQGPRNATSFIQAMIAI
jgi:Tfp pilus assembly protein PilX